MRKSLSLEMTRGTMIAAILMCTAAAAYMFLFFIPRMRSVSDTLAELSSKQSYILDAQKSRNASEQSQRELEEADAYIEQQEHQILAPHELPPFFSQISHIAKSNNAITTKFEPQPAIQYASFRKQAVVLGVSGSFSALHGVVRDLETMQARVWIDELRFRGSRENGKPAECDITLVVFVDNPEKTD